MANALKRRISNRHALDERELAFVRIYTAFGEKGAPEAYRRAYLAMGDDDLWYEKDRAGEPKLDKPVNNQTAYRKAQALLDQSHIQDYILELKQNVGDLARQQMADTVLFADTAQASKAAERVLAEEDKLGFRDAVEQWAEIMCAIGAEVVIPLPDGREIITPLREMFPHYRESLPPVDVIEKTILSLQDYRDARQDAEAAAEPVEG